MESFHFQRKAGPIGAISSILKGFDRVTARPSLLILPLLLDLFLWFGPHLGMSVLIDDVAGMVLNSPGAALLSAEQMKLFEEMVAFFSDRYNLFSSLSTLPGGMPFNLMFLLLSGVVVGVPSLMAFRMPIETPLGAANWIEIADAGAVAYVWIALAIGGLGLGSLYHRHLASSVDPAGGLESLLRTWAKVVLLALMAYVTLFFFFGALVLVAAEAGLIFVGFPVAFIAGIYFAFTPHGIVRYRFGIWRALKESANLVRRHFFSAVAFLFIAFFVIWITTTQIWLLPDEVSWYTALAILGHAFISATLLAASYVFFQDHYEWLAARREEARRIEASLAVPSREDEAEEGADAGV